MVDVKGLVAKATKALQEGPPSTELALELLDAILELDKLLNQAAEDAENTVSTLYHERSRLQAFAVSQRSALRATLNELKKHKESITDPRPPDDRLWAVIDYFEKGPNGD